MRTLATRLTGLVLLEPVVHGDSRGFFQETYRKNTFEALGIETDFLQENHSRSMRGVVRGMHFQPGMDKLIRCVRGTVFDVAVDIRSDSPTFGEWEGFHLDDRTHRQLFCPDGFAHGFCVLSEVADVVYRCSAYYDPGTESGFAYNDSAVNIDWPLETPLQASPRDASASPMAEVLRGARSQRG